MDARALLSRIALNQRFESGDLTQQEKNYYTYIRLACHTCTQFCCVVRVVCTLKFGVANFLNYL